jgi:CheY-specific phosphatase CheX
MHTELIEKSLRNIFVDVFRTDLVETQEQPIVSNFHSKIDIVLEHNKRETIYFTLDRETLQNLITDYMFEEDNDDEELHDFCREFANLIIGRAKVFAQTNNIFFDISTPDSVDDMENVKLKESFFYEYKGRTFMYGY